MHSIEKRKQYSVDRVTTLLPTATTFGRLHEKQADGSLNPTTLKPVALSVIETNQWIAETEVFQQQASNHEHIGRVIEWECRKSPQHHHRIFYYILRNGVKTKKLTYTTVYFNSFCTWRNWEYNTLFQTNTLTEWGIFWPRRKTVIKCLAN